MAENRIENSHVRNSQQQSDVADTNNIMKDSTAQNVVQRIDTKRRGTAILYAAISLVFLGIALLVGWWIFERATQLGPRFLLAYYGGVVVLGISAAIVLFGSLRSYAALAGHHGQIKGEVGGPAALFVLVVVGAFALAKPAESFTLVVRLTGATLDADAVSKLVVTVDLGQRLESRPVSSAGEAFIPEVSTSLVGRAVPVSLSPGRVHLKDPDQPITIPEDHVLYVPVNVDPPPDPRQTEARQRIMEVRKLVRMTLIGQNETLLPAFNQFKKEPTENNWRAVQRAATDLLTIVENGTREALEYDADFGPAVSEIVAISNNEGRPLINSKFVRQQPSLAKERTEWIERGGILRDVISNTKPSTEQADRWIDQLKSVYERLEKSLEVIEARLVTSSQNPV